MKKVIAMLLAAIMMVSLFAGCGNSASNTETQAPASNTPAQAPATGETQGVEQITLKVCARGRNGNHPAAVR